jgi:CubicO group peptidase (beta-lactamase class C family)
VSGKGLSPLRLERLHDALAGYVERGAVSGLVAAVSRHGETHVEVLGAMAFGGAAMRRDTIFRISSMTKPLIAAAAMILVEEGRVRLDEPVDRLLPELANRRVLLRLDGPLAETVAAQRPITVRDLLTFRMGFGIPMVPLDSWPIQTAISELALGQGPPRPSVPPAPDEWLRRLGTLPLMDQPGAQWMYNTGSDVLGVLIARAADRPLASFLSERLFEPLGMKDTGFHVPAEKRDRFATGYWGDLSLYDAPQGEWSRPPAFPSGGGGLVSTLDDYLAFGHMMLAKGRHRGERVLSRPAIELMTSDHLTPAQKAASRFIPGFFERYGWGFGVSVVTRRETLAGTVGAYGWAGGLGTSWQNDPQEDLVGVLMTQRAFTSPHPPDIHLDFWTLAYQAIED